MAIVMFVDGVLRTESGAPIYQGLALYKMFNEDMRVVLLCEDKPKTDRWLLQHKIVTLDDLVGRDVPGVLDDPEFEQIKYLRSQGPIDVVITSNIDLSKKLLEEGIDSLLFLHPSYFKAEYRPDAPTGKRKWAEIEGEIDRQIEMLKEDPRA